VQLRCQRPFHVKEMPVIPVNKVVDPKRIIEKKWRAKEEERHKGSLTKKSSIVDETWQMWHSILHMPQTGRCYLNRYKGQVILIIMHLNL
jgi:hypothetical protein